MRKSNPAYFWRFLRDYVLPFRLVCAMLIGNVVLQVSLGFWRPYSDKLMVDEVLIPALAHGVNAPMLRLAFELILSVVFVIGAGQVLVYFFNRLMFRLVAFISQRLRSKVAEHLLKLSPNFYDASQPGRLMMTALGDPSNITQQLTMGMIAALAQVLVVFGGCFILFGMSVPLTWGVIAVFPLIVWIFFVMRPRLVKISEQTRENWGILSGMVAEKIAGIRVVRTFAKEDSETEKFKKRVMYHAQLNIESGRINAGYGFYNGLSVHLGYMILFLLGGSLYFRGEVTLGTIVAFFNYFNRLIPAVLQICNLPQQILSAQGSLDKVFGLLDTPITIQNPASAKHFDEALKEIRFDKVSFRYSPHLPLALQDVSFSLKAGSQVGIVGPSGSGKSTLMALLLRFYDLEEGAILLNGRDVRDWELQSLRRAFAHVPQEQMLFTGTVRENIAYKRDMNESRIWEALGQAEAEPFVRHLDKGLESKIGERGVSLSGGQKQRLAIARALLSDPQCLILDNCTSALDGETEVRLQTTLRRILTGRTALIISHRVSSVLHCEQILVMDSGRLLEEGSASELLAQSGYFHAIQRQQAGAL